MLEQSEALSRPAVADRAVGFAGFAPARFLTGAQAFNSDVQPAEKPADLGRRFRPHAYSSLSINRPLGLLGQSYDNLSSLREQCLRCIAGRGHNEALAGCIFRGISRALSLTSSQRFLVTDVDKPEVKSSESVATANAVGKNNYMVAEESFTVAIAHVRAVYADCARSSVIGYEG